MRKQLVVFVALAVAAGFTTGCIFSPKPDKPPPPPPPLPLNDTPENAIKRFVQAYENKKGPEYENMFTEDFIFEFSNAADPELAQKYANGWFKNDEKTSARHLFEGFSDPQQVYQPAATSIDLTLAKTNPVNDNEGRDSTKFKVLATRVDGVIVVPTQPDPTTYLVDNNYHRFFLVRGDAALDVNNDPTVLPPLLADSTRWYIYRWIDETATLAAPGGGLAPASAGTTRTFRPATWSAVKASTR